MTHTEKPSGSAVGRVVFIHDNAKAISPDGMERVLSPDSPIYAYDRIITESNSRVSIAMDNDVHGQIDLGGMSNVIIDEDIFGGTSPEEIAGAVASLEEFRENFFLENVDLSEPRTSHTDEVDAAGTVDPFPSINQLSGRGDIASKNAGKPTIIFDQSDYADLDNGNQHDDPLDKLIDTDDTTSSS